MIDAKIEGLANLELALKEVGESVAPKAMRAAVRESAKVVHKSMQQNAQSAYQDQTGVLTESIKLKTTLNKRQTHNIYDVASYVGVYDSKMLQKLAGNDVPASVVAYWLELGVKPHDLNSKSRRSRGKVGEGKNNFHPGIEPRPFIRNSLVDNADNCLGVVSVELEKQIKRAAKKAAKNANVKG